MHAAAAHLRTALISLAFGFILLAGGLVCRGDACGGIHWFQAHGTVLTIGAVLPGLAALHAYTLERLAGARFETQRVVTAANLWLLGTLLVAAGEAWGPTWRTAWIAGALALAGGATIWSVQVMKHAPKGGLSDVERDPLTKGDDACLKHIHFAHRFLPIGVVLLLAAAGVGLVDSHWSGRIHIAAVHVLTVGYGLLSIYGLSHFWVPRLSGVPAIAAGAIKGELHTSLLGLVGVTAGFLVGLDTGVGRGLLVGLGPFVFLGFFVWMGVLGANIMKNKSPTNSVRPEFVYIPWTFSAVFWLVTSVLMGIFLNVLPDDMAAQRPPLVFAHMHVGLLGGAVQILLGLATRLLPTRADMGPPRFDAAMKGSFYLFNAGLAAILYGRFQAVDDVWLLGGLVAIVASLALFARVMAPFIRDGAMAEA